MDDVLDYVITLQEDQRRVHIAVHGTIDDAGATKFPQKHSG